ncbi:MAG: rhodanese-like domain-containing protein [Candidatus Thiodiazotropha sp.]
MKPFSISLLAIIFTLTTPYSLAETESFKAYPKTVDYEFVAEYGGIPRRDDVMVIDSRGARKFDQGHIPVSVNISAALFDSQSERLPKDKSSLLIFYCGGIKCPLSHKSAYKAEALGYTNIQVYAAGYPDWIANGGLAGVSAKYVKKALKRDDAVVIDSRPPRKYKKGHVPGSINIPTSRFDITKDRLPEDKSMELILYCGGYKCPLSAKGAAKAKALGYTNTKLYQAGYPDWKKGETKKLTIRESEEGVITIDSFMNVLENHADEFYLIDVRDQSEVDLDGTFANARIIPIETMLAQVTELPNDKPTIFFCTNGVRASEAYDFVNMKRNDMKAYFLDAVVSFKKQPLPVVSPLE